MRSIQTATREASEDHERVGLGRGPTNCKGKLRRRLHHNAKIEVCVAGSLSAAQAKAL